MTKATINSRILLARLFNIMHNLGTKKNAFTYISDKVNLNIAMEILVASGFQEKIYFGVLFCSRLIRRPPKFPTDH